ncbi:PPOX class F420-dependent oxidoreductase [Microlunatus soli]|uniref:PPOX class probable F420-dependent enzyme n=1 Tax=Microlunatus soli TaxID=630515 RepID=A0A1H1Z821_9ACTN|nr:PPOX class F420-dependent oxidoreductase [Microlunatus soli]SDT29848.1 PPOX class probable F420-dependent enzyme [Microlunatus soli]
MPKPPIPAEIEKFLAQPNPAIIATVRPDGQPVTVATWYGYEGGRILVNMDAGRKRLEYLRNDPRVSLTVLADSWYEHVSLQGRVVEIVDDTELAGIDRLSRAYSGNPYPNRDRPRVDAWIEIDRWHGWGEFATS